MRRSERHRAVLAFIAAAAILLTYMYTKKLSHLQSPQSSTARNVKYKIDATLHPVVQLHLRAKFDHEAFLTRQSRTYKQATQEYIRRYMHPPPPGFRQWYELAVAWNSPVVDDFDDIVEQLQPYQDYLLSRCGHSWLGEAELEAMNLAQFCFHDGKMFKSRGSKMKALSYAYGDIHYDLNFTLPNFCFLVNPLDEPRTILNTPSPSQKPSLHTVASTNNIENCAALDFVDLSHQTIMTEATLPCLINSPARRKVLTPSYPSSKTLTTTSTTSLDRWLQHTTTDICAYPRTLPQGTLHRPQSMHLTHDAIPILSTGKLSTFSDILFPTPHRLAPQFNSYNASHDIPWALKHPLLYWRGATTGGHVSVLNDWHHMQRQHLVEGLIQKFPDLVDLGFTQVFQCEEILCTVEELRLHIKEHEPLHLAWFNRYVLDIDDNGLSGRLYDLLRSRSAVLRYSMFQEWHDARLQPWLHYIPLALDDINMVGELLEFLKTEEGERVAEGVAEAGKEWVGKALGEMDMKLYFYRLILEMGRYY